MKNLKLLGEPQGEPIKPAETVATVEGCPMVRPQKNVKQRKEEPYDEVKILEDR